MKKLILSLALALSGVAAFAADAAKVQGDTVLVETKNLAEPMKVTVIQPEQALEQGNTKRFPTVYLLNGFGGDYRSWPNLTNPGLDSLATHYGVIFVCPSGLDSWYWNSPLNPKLQMESFFVEDLVPYIDANFPTIPQANKRAITGLSMGGHGALYLAMRHPDIWKNAGSTSGGVDIRPFPKSWKMKERLGDYESNKQVWEDNTVINVAKNLKPEDLNIIFDCGNKDFFAEVNENLHRQLLEQGIPHDYISRPGVHNHPYWRNSILFQLLFFNEQFKK